ncbi:MAG: NADPH:quinone oxidoreductase family protein [Roseovarius sp.]|nr:NADPH:quinone oxidoreductase family protein [Roseovarius sp.]MCY4209338.1 NADPH:quinone oxidoreductase family protein [Roseovarius sp.]MCY4316585.1 NADPH:quinone oxidoreductase family protein [Roseovarius sp.]
MRAFRIESTASKPALRDIARPTPGPGEISLKIKACGLNFADLLMANGTYQDTPDVPFTLGMEVSGIVDGLGENVDSPEPGTRVAVFAGQGGMAEYGCFPAERAVVLPDSMDFADAAAFLITYGTSHVALDYKAKLQCGETLLVLGAAGGVGLAAVEIGKLMGARVVACARGARKLAVAKSAGADHLINAKTDDIRQKCKELGGIDVVYDPVGGDQFKAAFRSCRPEARLLPIGFASGEIPNIPANHLLVKNLTVMGLYWGGYLKFRPNVVANSVKRLFHWYGEGRLAPHVSRKLPLESACEGLELMRNRKSTGKIVVMP